MEGKRGVNGWEGVADSGCMPHIHHIFAQAKFLAETMKKEGNFAEKVRRGGNRHGSKKKGRKWEGRGDTGCTEPFFCISSNSEQVPEFPSPAFSLFLLVFACKPQRYASLKHSLTN